MKILINRTHVNKDNWLKLKQVADIMETTREELLDKILAVWAKNTDIKIEMKK